MSKIAELRTRANLTQRQVADYVDVTETTIRNWETGRSGLDWILRVAKLCEILNCSPSELVELISIEGEEDKTE